MKVKQTGTYRLYRAAATGRGGARVPEPAERTEPSLVDGFRLRCAQYGAED